MHTIKASTKTGQCLYKILKISILLFYSLVTYPFPPLSRKNSSTILGNPQHYPKLSKLPKTNPNTPFLYLKVQIILNILL